MTRRAAFNQADVTRAVKGCQAAGIAVGTVTITTTGEIVIYAAGADSAPRPNKLDRLLPHGQR
jgi:hypothetical protein